MNVDVLKNNPAWWWYIPLAALTTLATFAVWFLFKRYKSVSSANLLNRFLSLTRFFVAGRQLRKTIPVAFFPAKRGSGHGEGLKAGSQVNSSQHLLFSTVGRKLS